MRTGIFPQKIPALFACPACPPKFAFGERRRVISTGMKPLALSEVEGAAK
jgi:hypothetical protein